MPGPDSTARKILVSDFDGTMTRRDFFQLVTENLLPADMPDYWGEYLAGEITHFEALQSIFGSVTAGETALTALVGRMELDPAMKTEVEALREDGWAVVVASAGCDWYIRKLLVEAGVAIEAHSNPGLIEDDRLVMKLPTGSDFYSEETGIDKVAVVFHAMARARTVAFAGDGRTDLAPSLLVPPSLRFARGVLAEELTQLGQKFRPFNRWSEVSRALREQG
jgi:2-hydroxy-3-keto-5-methylthiopentenyl-1-phosphate phosphatase